MITVAELRAQLALFPDDAFILAYPGAALLDIHGLETAADILRWHQEHQTPADVQRHLATILKPEEVYLTLAAFA
jgi:hypothetical protein